MKITLKSNSLKFLALAFFAVGALFYQTVSAQNLNLDASFTAGVSDAQANVYVSTTQPDGKILVGGGFQYANGIRKSNLARLNADGSLDNTFNASGSGPDAPVYEIIVLSDGKILIGGAFSSYNGLAAGGLIRLNEDGSLDATFNPGGAGAFGGIQDINVQSDGKIIISGSLSSYNGVSKFGVIRVNADGTLDTTFASPFTTNQFVEEVKIQSDGRILIAGGFTINAGVSYSNLARLNPDGSLDTTFNVSGEGPDGDIYALELQPDGKILIGGAFSTYNRVFQPTITRLNSNGSLDSSFNSILPNNASVEFFAVQSDGKILAAGDFPGFVGGVAVLRFNPDGSLDDTFQITSVDNAGYSVKLQADGKIIITGLFTRANDIERGGIMRLNSDGSLDGSFNSNLFNIGSINAIARQPDGKIVVGGIFTKADGTYSFNVARFNENGSLDATFNTGTGPEPNIANYSNLVNSIALQADGKILVGGTFSFFNGVFRPGIVRLNSDGSVDESFDARFFDPYRFGYIYDIIVQADGKILIGGYLFDPSTGQFGGLFRLNPDGSVDPDFTQFGNSTNNSVYKIAQQADGKILVGGAFTSYKGTPRNRIARINSDGTLDATFNPGSGTNGSVREIVSQSDGKIFIGGTFTLLNGANQNRLARLNTNGSLDSTFNVGTGANNTVFAISPQPNGKTLIGGFFSTYNGASANRLARINADGSLDTTFVSGIPNDPSYNVRDIVNQADGKVLIGGLFESYNGIARQSLLRLTPDAANRRTLFDYDGDGRSDISVFRPADQTWYLNQSTDGFAAVRFGLASDRIVPADYDGDGETDIAVYRNGTWYLLRSQDGFAAIQFGIDTDVPVPADFDGDGKAELAVYRNGTWYALNLATNQTSIVSFGLASDKPVVGDYDGDNKADYAVYRDGTWYLLQSTNGFAAVQFGISSDKPVVGNYDGDNKTDIAVYRDGMWYLLQSSAGFAAVQFGLATDLPTPGDYDGDGKTDVAVYRDGTWYALNSTQGLQVFQFGVANDKPTPNAYVR